MKQTIVILHGWRITGQKYTEIQHIFEKKGFQVLSPTLPGSGNVSLTKPVMNISDYIDFVLAYLKKEKQRKVIFLGHSFGGRIAAKLAALHPEVVEKLIVTGAPLIKQPLSMKKKILSSFAKLVKNILKISLKETRMRKVFYYLLGEWDYYKAPVEIRETFKKIIGEDLSIYLPKITVPTLIIWGGQDTFVGKTVGKQIASRIPHSIYKEIPEATHKVPYENSKAFAKIVLGFITTNE